MSNYKFNATNLIAKTFEEEGVHFNVVSRETEALETVFGVNGGPKVILRFISRNNDNDVAARIYGLITSIPESKRVRVMEVCNTLNARKRFVKFYIDTHGDVNVEYDFPLSCSDSCLGEMAYEVLLRMAHILDEEYAVLMRALYAE